MAKLQPEETGRVTAGNLELAVIQSFTASLSLGGNTDAPIPPPRFKVTFPCKSRIYTDQWTCTENCTVKPVLSLLKA